MHIKDVAEAVHATAVDRGWHPKDRQVEERIPEMVANGHGELSELWEAYRKGTLHQPCDKNIELTCLEEELADIVIRTFDTAEALGIDIEKAILAKHAYNKTRPWRHGGKKA